MHFLTHEVISSGSAAAVKSLQSCSTLCDPTDGSLPGSPVPGILRARVLEWVAIASPNPRYNPPIISIAKDFSPKARQVLENLSQLRG